MGIQLDSLQINGSGANTVSVGPSSASPSIYNVDLDSTNNVLLTGNWNNENGLDGVNDDGDGDYRIINAPSFGSISINDQSGFFSWNFDRSQAENNGGVNQTIEFQVRGLDSGGSTDTDTVQVNLTCFLKGTGIDTPIGEVAVEDLAMGDLVRTADGRDVAIRWVGKQTVSTLFNLAERLMPVRFSAGSLGDGMPCKDLTVTADHALLLDGVLCNAGALVNGSTIRQVPLPELGTSYEIYHIETEAHDIIVANGTPSETFIDYVSRRSFDNFAEYDELYRDEAQPSIKELSYPRVSSARLLPSSVRQRIYGETRDAG